MGLYKVMAFLRGWGATTISKEVRKEAISRANKIYEIDEAGRSVAVERVIVHGLNF